MTRLIRELVGRGVMRVAAAYLALAWLVLQVISTVSDIVTLPERIGWIALIGMAMGFPVALVISWKYRLKDDGEFSPETEESALSTESFGRRGIDYVIIGALVLVVATMVFERIVNPPADINPLRVENARALSTTKIIIPPASSPYPLVVDHSRVFFVSFVGNLNQISQVPQKGGQTTEYEYIKTEESSIVLVDGISPEFDELLFSITTWDEHFNFDTSMWQQPLTGGDRRFLAKAYQGDYTADGRYFVFTDGGTTLQVRDVEQESDRVLADLPFMKAYWPRFSADGTRVRATSFRDHFVGSLFEIEVATGEVNELFTEAPFEAACCGTWTPDGRFFVFQAKNEDGEHIWAVDDRKGADGEPFQVTKGQIEYLRPAFSPDGHTMFAISWIQQGELRELLPESGATRSLSGLEKLSADQPSFSPNGKQVAFVSFPDGDVWTKDLGTDRSTQISVGASRSSNVHWSPDSEWIVFNNWIPGEKRTIQIARSDGSKVQTITNGEKNAWWPQWNPGGDKVIFSKAGASNPQTYNVITGEYGELDFGQPFSLAAYSPDGRLVLGDDREGFMIFDTATERIDRIVDSGRIFRSVAWSSDGQGLLFSDHPLELLDRSVWYYDLHSQEYSRVAIVGNQNIAWGTDGRRITIGPNDNPVFLDDQSVYNIYAFDLLREAP